MITISKEAADYLSRKGVREIFLVLQYIKGPCNDNLCKIIPKVVVKTEKPKDMSVEIVSENVVKVYAIPPIAKAIKFHRSDQTISLTRVGKKLKIDGIPYAF